MAFKRKIQPSQCSQWDRFYAPDQKRPKTDQSAQSLPVLVNVKVQHLRPRGYASFEEWAAVEGHVYIGREVQHVNAPRSIWANPFSVRKYNRTDALRWYKNRISNDEALMSRIDELRTATELGCWCDPQPCHGGVLLSILRERRTNYDK